MHRSSQNSSKLSGSFVDCTLVKQPICWRDYFRNQLHYRLSADARGLAEKACSFRVVRMTCCYCFMSVSHVWKVAEIIISAQRAVLIICVNWETGITHRLGKGKVSLSNKFRGNRWKPFRFDFMRNKRLKAEYHICKFFWFCLENQNKLAMQVLTYAPHKWHIENFSQRWSLLDRTEYSARRPWVPLACLFGKRELLFQFLNYWLHG